VIPASSLGETVKPRWFGGVALEFARNNDFVRANNDGSLSGISADKTSAACRVFGGYSFNDRLGVEVGYTDLGKSCFTAQSRGGNSWAAGRVGTDFEADGWYLDGLVAIPIAPRWTLFVRVGALGWHSRETFFEENYGTSVDKDSGTDLRYGVALEYDIGRDDFWVFLGDATQMTVDDDTDKLTTVGMSLARKF